MAENNKLLILTQTVDKDDPILGFFHRWVEEFSKHYQSLIVICLYEGRHDLPDNVEVLSLGKESGRSRIKYLWNFYRYIWSKRNQYDSVFVHMNQIYVILGGFLWRLLGKKIGLWYAHKNVGVSLWLADKFAHCIFSSTAESFRLRSSKLNIIGHGIDVDNFRLQDNPEVENTQFTLLTVGRISPVKDLETVVRAVKSLKDETEDLHLKIIGGAGSPDQEKYFQELKDFVSREGLSSHVTFLGPLPHEDIPLHLKKSDVFVNMSKTGSLDKAILEAMINETLVITSNDSAVSIIKDQYPELAVSEGDPEELAEHIKLVMGKTEEERDEIGRSLSQIVRKDHNLHTLVKEISNTLHEGKE